MAKKPADRKKTVLVVGAGPAGLAAAARILEKGGADRFRVRLATLGHHVGGKASSWRDAEGRLIDHGQHVVIGFYKEMKGLLRRAGVDVEARLVSAKGHTYFYEPRDGGVHDLDLWRNPFASLIRTVGYSGYTAAEKANVLKFALSNIGAFLGTQDIERWDDVCFTTWCLANGLAPSIVNTNGFLMSRCGQLNWPGEISAYSMIRSARVIGRDRRRSEYAFPDGGMSERFWEPILGYIGSMGGELELMRKLVAVVPEAGRAGAVRFAEPDARGHGDPTFAPGASRYEGPIPTVPGSEDLDRDFDYLISTLPATAFHELNPGDPSFWGIPQFSAVRNIRGIHPMALQIWHREKVTRHYWSVVSGLEGPLPFVLDNKHIIRDYREDPRYGSVLYFVGQETGYESWTDEDHLTQCLASAAVIPGFERIDREGILHWQLIRHRSPSTAYFYTEPGIQKFRPTAVTPLSNFFLAGDWVRTDLDFPCMEAAVRSGLAAADALLRRAR